MSMIVKKRGVEKKHKTSFHYARYPLDLSGQRLNNGQNYCRRSCRRQGNSFFDLNLFSLFSSKKGDSTWISWILIISFSVGLGVFMYKWMTGFTTSTTNQMMSRMEESDCTMIGVSVLDSCQTVEELRLTLINKKGLNVDQFIINYVDIYDNPGVKAVNFSLRVNKREELRVLKQGIVKQFEIIPRAFVKDKIISCSDNTVIVEKIRHCT